MNTALRTDIPVFRRVTLALADTDPLAWLGAQVEAGVRVYWTARAGGFEVAGIGAAHVVTEPDALERVRAVVAQGDSGLRLYGGMRFDPARPSDAAWGGFDARWFVLPEIELVRDGDGTRLVANVLADGDVAAARVKLEALAAGIGAARRSNGVTGEPRARQDAPERVGWDRNLANALRAMEACEIDKVVLARRTAMTFDHALDPLVLLARLRRVTRDCYLFCFQPAAGVAFIGASPERFYKRAGRNLETEAVAGTRPRGANPDEDRRLGEVLLSNDKERREHVFVREMIGQALKPLCRDVCIDVQPSLFRLVRGQHLFSGVTGTLRDGVEDAALVEALHPTPAVGGTPTASALARIRAWEPFDRGWYAAPVGWVGRDEAEFAVAIRSALCRGRELSLFSGAGIVPGSSAAEEWDEIEHKIQDFVGVLRE